jgi:hypothetical protein
MPYSEKIWKRGKDKRENVKEKQKCEGEIQERERNKCEEI